VIVTMKLAYSPEEAARATELGRTSIFEAMRAGRIERRKIGARTIIPAESLRAFLASLPPRRDAETAA
jgi:hypothetical protein